MTVGYSKDFIKQAKKLSPDLKRQLQDRIALFVDDPFNSGLRNHALKGKYKDFRSINITRDVRALYLTKASEFIFVAVGSHAQLYG